MGSVTKASKISRKQAYYPWLILAGCCCMQIGGIGVFLDSCGVFYVPAASALGISVSAYSKFLSFSFIGTIPAAIIAGNLIKKVDIRYLIGVNVVLTAVILMCMGYYPYMWMRYVAGFMFGFSGGFYFMIMTPTLINNWFARRKGLAMGIAMASSGVGAAILSPLITLLIQNVGWQLAYVLTGVFVMVLILPWAVFVFRFKPEDMGLRPYGWQTDGAGGSVESSAQSHERGVPSHIAIKTVSFFCVCAFIGCIAVFSTYNSYLNAFGQALGYSALTSSTFLAAVSIGSMLEKFIMGFLYDYIGVYRIIWINCGLLAVGLILLGTQTALTPLYIGAALFGVQNSLVAVQAPLLVRELFGDRDCPRLISYTRVGVGVFGMIGPFIVSAVFDASGSYQPVWMTSLGFVGAAVGFVVIAYACRKRFASQWRTPTKDEETADTRDRRFLFI